MLNEEELFLIFITSGSYGGGSGSGYGSGDGSGDGNGSNEFKKWS